MDAHILNRTTGPLRSSATRLGLVIAAAVLAVLVIYLADTAGLWLVTPLAGLLFGVAIGRWYALLVCLVVGVLAWGVIWLFCRYITASDGSRG